MDTPTIDSKRQSAIVDQFVTTDLPLSTIIQQSPAGRTPVAIAILQLQECLGGRLLAKMAMKTAQDTVTEGEDLELVVLMLCSWAELSCRLGRPSEAEALIHRAKTILNQTSHPEIKAAIRFAESVMADTLGDKETREKIVREVLSILPTHSPRRKFYVWDLAVLLAQQGRAMEAQEDLKTLSWQCTERFKAVRISVVQFIDAVETGRIVDAAKLLTRLTAAPPGDLQFRRVSVNDYHALLNLMHKALSPVPPAAAMLPASPATWVEIVSHLMDRTPEEALKLARLEAKKVLGSLFGTGFDAFGLIRAELSCGHWESAIRLLKMRQARGNHHYLDSLFFARAERLAGNKALAARQMADAIQKTEQYQAKGRLDFELKLSCELSPDAIQELLDSATAAAAAGSKSGTAPMVTAPPPLPHRPSGIQAIIGRSKAATTLRETVLRFADLATPVLITGETGTGKELVARALHDSSKKRTKPFNAVNCSVITETLLESELFGHERGAFTGADRASRGLFESTADGTIFLDEIGDISPRLQSALLRVLETGEIRAVGSSASRVVNCRIVAATNAELSTLVEKGTFRKDLLFRLQRLEIHVPPIRERREDTLPLARYFFDQGRRIGEHAILDQDLIKAMETYNWPGNVRELRNVVERMRLMHSDKLRYAIEDLELKFQAVNSTPSAEQAPPPAIIPESAPPPTVAAPTPAAVPTPHPLAPPSPQDPSMDAIIQSGRSMLRRHDRIRSLFRQYSKLTRAEIITALRVSPNTATKDLDILCSEGFIERVEPSASSRSFYFRIVEKPAPPSP
jgi:DNA-binding NtrC family response regulator